MNWGSSFLKNYIIIVCLVLACFLATPLKARPCEQGLRDLLHRIFYTSKDLRVASQEKLVKARAGKKYIDYSGLIKHIKNLPEAVASISEKRAVVDLIGHYRRAREGENNIFDFENLGKEFGTNNPEFGAVFLTLHQNIQTYRARLMNGKASKLRGPFRFVHNHKWIVLGTTVFVLWTPIQAEITSFMYGAFNEASGFAYRVLGLRAPPLDEGINPAIQELRSQMKTVLRRDIYWETQDRYPQTLQASRNSLNYVYDMILRRRSELEYYQETNDEASARLSIFHLYEVILLFDDLFENPIGGLMAEAMNDTLQKYDPDARYFDEFLSMMERNLKGNFPPVELPSGNSFESAIEERRALDNLQP